MSNDILGIEAFHSMQTGRPHLDQDCMMVKPNIMKAYNLIECSYLKWMLLRMCFPIAGSVFNYTMCKVYVFQDFD